MLGLRGRWHRVLVKEGNKLHHRRRNRRRRHARSRCLRLRRLRVLHINEGTIHRRRKCRIRARILQCIVAHAQRRTCRRTDRWPHGRRRHFVSADHGHAREAAHASDGVREVTARAPVALRDGGDTILSDTREAADAREGADARERLGVAGKGADAVWCGGRTADGGRGRRRVVVPLGRGGGRRCALR